MSKIEWTIDDHNQSIAQGWLILNNGDATRIIRNDDLDIFENDRQALKHVTEEAVSGSKFHQKALNVVYDALARETVRDGVHINHCCKHCGCKYNDIDCPVVLGKVESKYECDEDHSKTYSYESC